MMEVATLSKEYRIRWTGIPESRTKYRKLNVSMTVEKALIQAFIAFIVCVIALTAFIAALGVTLIAGPITWKILLESFKVSATACLSATVTIQALARVAGDTQNIERWGDWG